MPPTEEELLIDDWCHLKLKEGSAEELEARKIIAHLLRHGPLKLRLRVDLATLIDPQTRDVYGWWLTSKRRPGAQRTMDRFRVAEIIWKQVKLGIKKESAVQDTMTRCNVSRSKALAAYKEYKHFLDQRAKRRAK